jgi:hypothetical protein
VLLLGPTCRSRRSGGGVEGHERSHVGSGGASDIWTDAGPHMGAQNGVQARASGRSGASTADIEIPALQIQKIRVCFGCSCISPQSICIV